MGLKPYADHIRKVVFTVLVERLARHAVEIYVMPHVQKIPTGRKKPFGFH